ncbi:MAG: CsbD family protein [Pseudonocardiaceae bacterium]
MGGAADRAKGRTKEAFGRLTGNRRMEREGKVDRSAGAMKDVIDKVKHALTGRRRPYR